MFELTDILLFSLLLAFLALCWNSISVHEFALQATKNHCVKMDVQLLDEGLALQSFNLKRNKQGSVSLWRSYSFEFTSTGEARYRGRIVLLGNFIESIQLDPHRLN